jgi:3-oxoacyl-[acyl-carrier protein] reductase
MLLARKNAVVYGAGGSVGGAVARAFAREGARVHLAGRTPATLDHLAAAIRAAGGTAQPAQVDALDEQAVNRFVDQVAARAGSVDISFNVISSRDVQGTPLADMSVGDFLRPITTVLRSHFLTGRAAARHMLRQGAGVVLAFGGSGGGTVVPNLGGFQVALEALEAFRRQLACEVGPRGVRVVTLQTGGLAETVPEGFEGREELVAGLIEPTLLRRAATLEDVGNVAAFVASDKARTMTATGVNITCGAIVD